MLILPHFQAHLEGTELTVKIKSFLTTVLCACSSQVIQEYSKLLHLTEIWLLCARFWSGFGFPTVDVVDHDLL